MYAKGKPVKGKHDLWLEGFIVRWENPHNRDSLRAELVEKLAAHDVFHANVHYTLIQAAKHAAANT